MRKKKNGFTLVEVIATVTILGILSVIGIVSVTGIIDRGKEEHYDALEENTALAAESYVQVNRDKLPKNIGEKTKIPAKVLVEDNYIEPLKDYQDKQCDLDNSYVQIYKYSKTGYSYITYLKCPNYSNSEEIKNMKPTITIKMTDDNSNVKKTKAIVNIEDKHKILSYTITVYKYDEEVYTTGNMEANYETSVTKTIDISKYTPGTIKVVAQATNIYGQTETKSMTKTYKDRQAPECIIAEADKTRDNSDWINGDRKITVGCSDGEEGSGCARETFTKTFKSDAKTGTITIKDNAGNETKCTVDVYIDKTAPNKCEITLDGTEGENDWYVSNVDLTLSSGDAMSGIAKKSLQATSGLTSYNGKSTGTQTETKSATWYGYIEDYAGNRTNCKSETFKVDTTPPATPTGGSISVSGSATTATLGAVSGGADATSGFKEFRYQVINNNANYPANSSDKFTTSRKFTRSCGTTYYGYAIAIDNAGNRSAVYRIGTASDGKNEYSTWGTCTKKCGGGTQTRTNSCALVTTELSQACNKQDCCSSITYENWAGWSTCTASCGGGKQTRTRNKISAYDGRLCGTESQTQACNTQACCSKVNYGNWTGWSTCTAKCGGGKQTRTRVKTSAYNGTSCGTESQTQDCNTQACCSSVNYGNWSEWSTCTATCGGGTQTRTRSKTSAFNGTSCGTESQTQNCNTQGCCSKVTYEDGNSCSASCGDGTYNQLAYSYYTGGRCPDSDTSTGGSYCNLGSCEEDIYETRYYECDSYYITTCTSTTCKYSQKNGSSSSGTINRNSLTLEKPASCIPVAKAQCYAFLYAKNGATVTFTTSDDEACAIKSVSGGSCSISNKQAHRFNATYGGVGSSCSFYVSIEGVYKYQGKEYSTISWSTRRTSTGFCTDSCCI